MYVCMYVCMYIYIYIYIHIPGKSWKITDFRPAFGRCLTRLALRRFRRGRRGLQRFLRRAAGVTRCQGLLAVDGLYRAYQ